jgi:hypothetical protein
MFHLPVKDIRDCFDPPMRVPREAFQVVSGVIGMKIVQKQEWIQKGDLLIAEGSLQMNTGSFERRFAFQNLFDLSNVTHGVLLAPISYTSMLYFSFSCKNAMPKIRSTMYFPFRNPLFSKNTCGIIDGLVKVRLSRASGKPDSINILKRLDSHFHGNDGKIDLRIFYETIHIEERGNG